MLQSVTEENKDKLQESLNTPQGRESIGQVLITRKTVQRLVEIAKGSVAEVAMSGDESLTKNAKIMKEEEEK